MVGADESTELWWNPDPHCFARQFWKDFVWKKQNKNYRRWSIYIFVPSKSRRLDKNDSRKNKISGFWRRRSNERTVAQFKQVFAVSRHIFFLPICMYVCLSISVCRFVRFVCISHILSVCLFVYVHLFVCLFFTQYICLSFHLCLSVFHLCVSICISSCVCFPLLCVCLYFPHCICL